MLASALLQPEGTRKSLRLNLTVDTGAPHDELLVSASTIQSLGLFSDRRYERIGATCGRGEWLKPVLYVTLFCANGLALQRKVVAVPCPKPEYDLLGLIGIEKFDVYVKDKHIYPIDSKEMKDIMKLPSAALLHLDSSRRGALRSAGAVRVARRLVSRR